jgi:hypothetical protein
VRTCALLAALMLLLGVAAEAPAQFKKADPGEADLGESRVQRMRSGIIVQAVGGPCKGIVGYTAVPTDWPEQTVKIVEEDVSSTAKVKFEMVDGMANVMKVVVQSLDSGEEAKAVVTFEVRRHCVLPPKDTDQYVLPDPKKLDRNMRAFLAPSPMIESRDGRIRDLAKKIGADQQQAWKRVEAIYDWVRENVQYKNGPLKGALAALKDGTGDCEELTSLFIAICRAAGVPARTVWVEGHCYPEFYLEDPQGEGHWFPCQAAGSRAFGEIPENRPVLQKGDNIRPPYNRHEHQRYMADHLTGAGGRPRIRFVREMTSD